MLQEHLAQSSTSLFTFSFFTSAVYVQQGPMHNSKGYKIRQTQSSAQRCLILIFSTWQVAVTTATFLYCNSSYLIRFNSFITHVPKKKKKHQNGIHGCHNHLIIHCIPGHSQDINNTATPMLMRDAIHRSYIPSMEALVETLRGRKVARGRRAPGKSFWKFPWFLSWVPQFHIIIIITGYLGEKVPENLGQMIHELA